MHHDWAPLNHTLDIDSVPSNDICDVTSGDTDCLTINHKLYTIHFCSPLFSLVFADHLSDVPECVFAGGSSAENLFHKCRTRYVHQSYFRSELIAHDHHVFPPTGICVR